MPNDLIRELIVTADGNPVESFNRACLRGSDMLGLYPMPFSLKIWNLSFIFLRIHSPSSGVI